MRKLFTLAFASLLAFSTDLLCENSHLDTLHLYVGKIYTSLFVLEFLAVSVLNSFQNNPTRSSIHLLMNWKSRYYDYSLLFTGITTF